jgi:hypothetical protein
MLYFIHVNGILRSTPSICFFLQKVRQESRDPRVVSGRYEDIFFGIGAASTNMALLLRKVSWMVTL